MPVRVERSAPVPTPMHLSNKIESFLTLWPQ
jgi:hypothetical protein